MTVVNTDTGEVLDPAAADRRAMKISLRLDAMAENYEAVLPMIREAIRLRDDLALGYRSPGDYVADRFGNALARLPIELRRETVKELSAAGLTTRAIAPIVGVSQMTVVRDVASETNVSLAKSQPVSSSPDDPTPSPPPPLTGVNGKTYQRPEPKTPAQRRRPLPDVATDAGWDLRRAVAKVERVTEDDRFLANKEQVATQLRSHLAHAIEVCQDLLDRINN